MTARVGKYRVEVLPLGAFRSPWAALYFKPWRASTTGLRAFRLPFIVIWQVTP